MKSNRFIYAACLVFLNALLTSCGGDIETSNLVIEKKIPTNGIISPKTQSLVSSVWVLSGYKTAPDTIVWFSNDSGGFTTHWITKNNGLIDMANLLSEYEASSLSSNNKKTDTEQSHIYKHSFTQEVLNDTKLPMVPFDLIPVGNDLLVQSQYGKLIFVQYLQFDPGERRFHFYPAIDSGAWAAIESDSNIWQKLKKLIGLREFEVHSNLAMIKGFRDELLPRPRVYFTGGGKEVLDIIEKHGAALFDDESWKNENHRLLEGLEEEDRRKHSKVTFVHTNLEVPTSETDHERIDRIVEYLNKDTHASTGSVESPSSAAQAPPSPPVTEITDPSGIKFSDWARSFANPKNGWNLTIDNHPLIRCKAASNNPLEKDPSANLLANTATSQAIAVYVHGLNVFADGAQPSLDELSHDWQGHIDILKNSNPNWGYCIVAWNTQKGITDEQNHLASLLFALRTLADHKEHYDPSRHLTIVAHSAGGLYAKQAFLQLQNLKSTDDYNPLSQAPNIPMRIVTLGSPHQGADFASSADNMSAYFPMLIKLSNVNLNEQATKMLQQHLADKATYQGVIQMRPIANNPWLQTINQRFDQYTDSDFIWSVSGSNDKIVSPQEAYIDQGQNLTLDGYDHQKLLVPGEDLAKVMRQAYNGHS